MKYPKKLHVGLETYKVKFVNKFADGRTVGECDPESKEIRILKGQTKNETLSTFIHEVLHALSFEGDFKIKHKTVYALEKAIVELFLKNFW